MFNAGVAKLAVQCSTYTIAVNQHGDSTSAFVLKINTFAEAETFSGNHCETLKRKRHIILK